MQMCTYRQVCVDSIYLYSHAHLYVAEQHFIILKRAKEVLLDKEMRKKYDEWRKSGFGAWISFDHWLSIQSRVHTVSHRNMW